MIRSSFDCSCNLFKGCSTRNLCLSPGDTLDRETDRLLAEMETAVAKQSLITEGIQEFHMHRLLFFNP